jgi:hypothetical protein
MMKLWVLFLAAVIASPVPTNNPAAPFSEPVKEDGYSSQQGSNQAQVLQKEAGINDAFDVQGIADSAELVSVPVNPEADYLSRPRSNPTKGLRKESGINNFDNGQEVISDSVDRTSSKETYGLVGDQASVANSFGDAPMFTPDRRAFNIQDESAISDEYLDEERTAEYKPYTQQFLGSPKPGKLQTVGTAQNLDGLLSEKEDNDIKTSIQDSSLLTAKSIPENSPEFHDAEVDPSVDAHLDSNPLELQGDWKQTDFAGDNGTGKKFLANEFEEADLDDSYETNTASTKTVTPSGIAPRKFTGDNEPVGNGLLGAAPETAV